ncbi:MAG: LuxR C-terminal-related transcriptional regulator [Bacteroidota bacterium]
MNLRTLLSKYQTYVLVLAIVLSSIAISIRSSEEGVRLVLQDYPVVIFFLIMMSSFLVVLYVQTVKRKISTLSDQIKHHAQHEHNEIAPLIHTLTTRQREVYELIISGKSNKEITNELFIEQSTLKTHINQIYKKLDIKSRGELKRKIKS